jgi:hypothetical protein
MRWWNRAAARWALRAVLVLLLLTALYMAVLAAPYPLFPHKHAIGEFAVRSSHPIHERTVQVIEATRERIKAMEYYKAGGSYRVFICGNERLYSLFAFLTRKSPKSQAIGLCLFGNMYMNEARIRRLAARIYGTIPHSRFDGDFSGAISHEIAHFMVVREVGFRKAIALPIWKSEGYADYQAHRATAVADSMYRLTDRIALLRDDAFWSHSNSPARRFFEWHLLVEYLAEVKGFGLRDLLEETVTESGTRAEMLDWYRREER